MYFSSRLSTIYVLLILCLEPASGRNEDSVDGSLVTFDDDNLSDDEDESSTRYLENGLCVPQDRLEDIDFFPNFKHDLIRLGHTLESEVEFPNDLECNKDYVAKVLRGKPSIENSFNDSGISVEQDDESKDGGLEIFSSYHNNNAVSVRRKNIGVGKFPLHIQKKPRTKRLRKGNQILTFPVLEKGGGKRILENEDGKRRCRHCQAEDTPQWRIGPSGPNTLCNACGLRYKVGRLVPNYRPAASPSFDSAKHSNFYKRLMRERDYVNR